MNSNILSNITPAVKIILIINIISYFLIPIIGRILSVDEVHILGLHLPSSPFWKSWQYISYMFMHGSLAHIFSNMFGLFMFGRVLESIWGTKRFVIFYFVCGIGAGALNSAIGWFEMNSLYDQYNLFLENPSPSILSRIVTENIAHPSQEVWNFIDAWIDNPSSRMYIEEGKTLFSRIIDLNINVPMVGASGAIFGILLAFGMLFPNTELYLMFIPIPIKAKFFVIGYGMLEIYLGLQQNVGDNVAHFAHIGGMIFGFILLKIWGNNRKLFY